MIKVDKFLKIGKSHKVCEDYIISGIDPFPYIILTDGCSSSKYVDVGARILAHVTLSILKANQNQNATPENCPYLCEEIIEEASEAAKILDLPETSLDSTLIALWKTKDNINLVSIGDGLYVTKFEDNQANYFQISYDNNYPFYLSYLLSESRMSSHKEKCGEFGRKTIDLKVPDNISSFKHNMMTSLSFPPNPNTKIIISSDGLESFINIDTGIKTPTKEIIDKVMDFKNTTGEFLQRRMNRVIKDLEKERIYHDDDISIGILSIEGDQECK